MVIIALLLALRFRSFTADTLLPLTRIELPTPKSEVPASLSVPEPFVVRVVPPVEVIFEEVLVVVSVILVYFLLLY